MAVSGLQQHRLAHEHGSSCLKWEKAEGIGFRVLDVGFAPAVLGDQGFLFSICSVLTTVDGFRLDSHPPEKAAS